MVYLWDAGAASFSCVDVVLHHCSPVIGSADSMWIPDAVNE